jgi:hypothetical protein
MKPRCGELSSAATLMAMLGAMLVSMRIAPYKAA